MMKEAFSTNFQLRSQLAQIRVDETVPVVDQRVESKNEVDGIVGQHRERVSIVLINLDARIVTETAAARFVALVDFFDEPQVFTVILEVMRPPPITGSDLKDCASRQKIANPWKDHSSPLGCRSSPRFRPFFASVFPILHKNSISPEKWLGAESNRRHVDFQSTALPTELPSRSNQVSSHSGSLLKQKTSTTQPGRPPAMKRSVSKLELLRHLHRSSQQTQIMASRNFDAAELLEMRREPLGVEQREFPFSHSLHQRDQTDF